MWRGNTLMAVRKGAFKAHFFTRGWVGDAKSFPHNEECYAPLTEQNPPLMYDVGNDPSESYSLDVTVSPYSDILADLQQLREAQVAAVVLAPSQTDLGSSPDRFPCCNPTCTPRPFCCKCDSA